MRNGIVVYGSYGYTGKLIVQECKRKGIDVLLSGRDEMKLQNQSEETGYSYKKCSIDDHEKLVALLHTRVSVVHCGGPFIHTAKHMVEACLRAKTHYIDITGEIAVFELLMKYDAEARDAGIMILPGAGFDVVPTDCLAMHLKNKLPDATHLRLAFKSGGGLSRGTINTIITSLGDGGMIREDGALKTIRLGSKTLDVDFGPFKASTLCIPWGDVSTAFWSTAIPNIEVYTVVDRMMLRWIKLSYYINWLLRAGWIKKLALRRMKNFTGPGKVRIEKSKATLWGKVWNPSQSVEASFETPSGYILTARSSVIIAEKILDNNYKTGYQTPSRAYGEGLVFELEGSRWL